MLAAWLGLGGAMLLFLQPLRKYADFRGRARRAEYWSFALLAAAPLAVFSEVAYEYASLGTVVLIPFLLTFLLLITPSLAVQARRLHDTHRSGWWTLIALVPMLGQVILLLWLTDEGDVGGNRFGPDPTGRPNPAQGVTTRRSRLYLQPFWRWSDFKGRARRTEFWQFVVVVSALTYALGLTALGLLEVAPALTLVCVILFAALLVAWLAVEVRRLHDTGQSGWWSLLALIPVLGQLGLLVMLIQDGAKGDNRFGPDPKGRPSPMSATPEALAPEAGPAAT